MSQLFRRSSRTRMQTGAAIKWLLVAGICGFMIQMFLTPFNRFPDPVLKVFREAEKVEVLTLDPRGESSDDKSANASDPSRFHGFGIVDRTVVSSAADREKLAAMLNEATWGAWKVAACFYPRHAFRVHHASGVWDILLCFQCGQARIHRPDGVLEGTSIGDRPDAMNACFRDLGLKLAP